MIITKRIFLLFFIFYSSLVSQLLKVEDYIKIGIENNKKMKSLENIVISKRNAVKQAEIINNPTLEIEAGNKEQFLGFFQDIEYPGKIDSRKKIAEEELKLSQAELNAFKRELESQLFTEYIEMVYSNEKIKLYEEYKKIINELNFIAKYKYEQGFSNKLDLIKSKIELTKIERLLNDEIKNKEQLLRKIRLNISFDSDSIIFIEDKDIFIRDYYDEIEVISLAINNNPNIAIEKCKINIAKATTENVLLSKKPLFNIGLKTGFDEGKFAASLNFGMPLNLWDTKENAIEEQKYIELSVQKEYENVVKEIKKKIATLLIEIKNCRKNIEIYEKELLKDIEEEYIKAKESYKSGDIKIVDYLDAQRTYLEVRTEYVDCKKNLINAKKSLISLIGISILEN